MVTFAAKILSMRKKIAAGNWKMNLGRDQAVVLTQDIAEGSIPEDVHVILGTPFIYLHELNAMLQDVKGIKLAAQNCHQMPSGAYTGEVSASMLKSIGIEYVILGHSERRMYFNESDELLRAKVDIALKEGLKVIFCCGEPLEIREANSQNGYVSRQLVNSLFHLSEADFSNIVIAYEPIWAIGTGKTASAEQAQEMHAFIRALVQEKYSAETAVDLSILYGGSVKPANASELFANPDVDGGLVGGASLDAQGFLSIINAF